MRLRLFAALACLVAVAACQDTPTEQPAAPPELRLEIQGDSLDFGGFVPLNGGDPLQGDSTCVDGGGGMGSGTRC